MSEDANPPERPDVQATVKSSLFFSTASRGKDRVLKYKRDTSKTKTKEADHTFVKGKEGYKSLLEAILKAHDLGEKYGVKSSTRCPLKICAPGDNKSEKAALSVDNISDYDQLVVKINQFAYPASGLVKAVPKILCFIEMVDIEKSMKKIASNRPADASDEDLDDGESIDGRDTQAGDDLNDPIAAKAIIIRNKWGHDHNSAVTYIHAPPGSDKVEQFALTPLMIKDWATEIHEDLATKQAPSAALLQQWRKKQVAILDPEREGAHAAQALPPSTSRPTQAPTPTSLAEGQLTLDIIRSFGSLVSQLGGHPAAPATPQSNLADMTHLTPHSTPPVAVPSTPTMSSSALDFAIRNTPTKLHRFLEDCVEHDIPNALTYELRLTENAIGPDILLKVDNKDLVDIGIPKGDIIRLKDHLRKWGPAEASAKRPRAETNPDSWTRGLRARRDSLPDEQRGSARVGPVFDPVPHEDPNKRVAYRITRSDLSPFVLYTFGPSIVEAEDESWKDAFEGYTIMYRNGLTNTYEPIPEGWEPLLVDIPLPPIHTPSM
ncbi:hypothetical protein EV121DRAFT_289930 [Schizophyllum commune]